MDESKCPLCLGVCRGHFYVGRDNYDCPECKRFAFKRDTSIRVETFLLDREDARKALSKYIKSNQVKDGYVELDWGQIKDILKKAGVSMEGLLT